MTEMSDEKEVLFSAKSLAGFVKCFKCLRVPREDVLFECAAGHLTCSPCHAKEDVCIVCGIRRRESHLAGKILAYVPRECPFRPLGCPFSAPSNRLRRHEVDCPLRLVCCVDLRCDLKVSLAKLRHHLKESHGPAASPLATDGKAVIALGVSELSRNQKALGKMAPVCVGLSGRLFYFQLTKEKERWSYWAVADGGRDVADRFGLVVKLLGHERGPLCLPSKNVAPIDDARGVGRDDRVGRLCARQILHYVQRERLALEIAVHPKDRGPP